MMMADQDNDGSHFKGLIINYFHFFWPLLLRIDDFLVEFNTPIMKAFHCNGTKLSFYSMPNYESWRVNVGNNVTDWTTKYYKGLGTNSCDEGREYFETIEKNKKKFIWKDKGCDDAIEKAFSKNRAKDRRQWMLSFEPGNHRNHADKEISYKDFIDKELILFSRAHLKRSIPSMVDGLKLGQRKVVFCALKKKLYKQISVAQLSGYVSEQSAYHHGEQSLAGTIIKMTHSFVGGTNINLLLPNGQFGTRNLGR